MKKMHLLSLLLGFAFASFAQIPVSLKDTALKAPVVKKDRNMFGYGITRGLTKFSAGLADGYILFAVPNSDEPQRRSGARMERQLWQRGKIGVSAE